MAKAKERAVECGCAECRADRARCGCAECRADRAKSNGLDLKLLRIRLGENQTQFALRVGVCRPTIWRWEKHGPPKTGMGARLLAIAVASINGGADGRDGVDRKG